MTILSRHNNGDLCCSGSASIGLLSFSVPRPEIPCHFHDIPVMEMAESQARHTTCRATFLEYPFPVAGFASQIPKSSRKSSAAVALFYINVGDQLSLQLAPITLRVYQPRGINALQFLFKKYFQSFSDEYEAKHAMIYGRFRIERITEVVEKFVLCGDYNQGVAHIQCTNPDCKYEYFRPFSCKSFYFCPPCSQKRTLLFSEYMNERLLLALPHRQFVFTFPKLLRAYLRHNRRLFSEISRLIFAILQRFYEKATQRPVRTGMVLAYQTSGEFLRWNPHFHCLVLEGGFDDMGKFVHIPLGDFQRMSECFRRVIIKFFLKQELISARTATGLINWRHSGFSVDASVRIPAFSDQARQALSQSL